VRASAVAVRRLVNDAIRETANDLQLRSGDERFEFVCECGDLRCRRHVTLVLADYDATEPGSVTAHA
jgi:hypothetical protein